MRFKQAIGWMLLFTIGASRLCAQPNAAAIPVVSFSDVQHHLFINYAHGMSKGLYHYTNFKISRTDKDFRIEARDQRKAIRHWFVPLTVQEKNVNATDTANRDLLFVLNIQRDDANYVSEKKAIRIGDSIYTVYHHQQMNCYDPLCGQKHNHLSMRTGEIWFSTDYGVLVQSDASKMQYILLKSIRDKAVPHQLILEILKQQQAPAAIVKAYADSQ
ncbi:MAG TPA: hypothetical protein PKK69_08350 [Ferruginibacter sp.]|nr:hypothetical protein [Ferruginibacter sp.]